MKHWNALLLVYRELDVSLPLGRPTVEGMKGRGSGEKRPQHFRHSASDAEIDDAVYSFGGFPELVKELTVGRAEVVPEIVQADRVLDSLTARNPNEFWPSPDNTRPELDRLAPAGRFDSIFVFWPQHDFARGISIPGFAWGLGMGASDWTNGATYAAIANAPKSAWRNEARGEVWLHEWLHGVCHRFAQRGYEMPARDADGGHSHGYVRSPTAGWTGYYRDLMNGSVLENGKRLGITVAAWGRMEEADWLRRA